MKEWKSEQEIEEEAYWTPDPPMSPELAEANRRFINSIIHAGVHEGLEFSEEDLENQP